MKNDAANTDERKMTSVFERYLSVWVLLCIVGGILLGKIAPGVAQTLDGMAITVNGAPVVSIPIAVCLFFMMYPIMVKIDFGEVIKAGKSGKPVFLTLFINWAVKPFTMYAIALFFLGTLFYGFIGPEAMDLVKMPFGLDLPVGAFPRRRHRGSGRRHQDAGGAPVAQLPGRMHPAGHRAVHGHGAGVGISVPGQ
jgi:ACR3 family arsenite transporter